LRKNPIPPHPLLDDLANRLGCANDRELAHEIGCAPSMISKFRHRTCNVSAALIIEMHEKFGMSIAEIKLLIEQANDQHVRR
jgi:transcriptional regulator with XRE-family HTH domain